MIDLKKYIKDEISNQGIDLGESVISKPPKDEMGDFSLPCFKVVLDGVNNPNEKAKYLEEHLVFDKDIIVSVKAFGPYVNFVINRDYLVNETLGEIFLKKDKYGSLDVCGEKLLIEHTSINPNASPHIGRSRNSIIGDFLVRLYRFVGYDVETHYFINDIGKQISMLLVGTEMFSDIKNITFNEMLSLYVKINDLSKSDESILKKVFYYLNELENGNEEVREKFRQITDICLKGQRDIFSKIDISWDYFKRESDFVFEKETDKVLSMLKESGRLLEDEDNRYYVSLEGYDIPTKNPVLVLTREDKTSLYPLRDIAYTIFKLKRNSSNNFIVLGEDQEVYMKQIAAVLDILGYKAPSLITYAFVLLDGNKMATREGKVVLLEDLIDITMEKIRNTIDVENSYVSDSLVSSLVTSCIKYNMLNVSRRRIVNFNLDEATNFHGNSAIYLLYNYARINSILAKAKYESDFDDYCFNEDIEFSIIKDLYNFKEIILSLVETKESIILTNYLYSLTQKFARYYENVSILKETDDRPRNSRLALIRALKIVLENGMKILGVTPLERI